MQLCRASPRCFAAVPGRAQLFEPFFADFGPLNLGKAYRYCRTTRELLQVRQCCAQTLGLLTGLAPPRL